MIFNISIPVRGQSELLGVALASIAAQKVILQIAIMDASPDDAVQKVVKQHQLLPIAYIRHGADSGQAEAIGEGWQNLEGDILHWLNADDYLLPDSLVAVEHIFNEHPEIDVVYGDAIFETLDGGFLSYFPEISDDPANLIAGCCICQPACFARRNIVEKIGGINTRLNFIMDWDLWTRLYLSGAKFFYLNRPLAAVRIHPGTKTATGGSSRLREIHNHLWKYAGLGTWARSMVAFMADSGAAKRNLLKRSVNAALSSYRLLKRGLGLESGFGSKKELYGIDSRTNLVDREAVVWLSWYNHSQPRELRIVSGLSSNLEVFINYGPAQPKVVSTAKSFRQDIFTIPEEFSASNLFRVRIRSSANRPWVLHSARIC
jgi:glycosyltransferase involved in cell wall biosynthesis